MDKSIELLEKVINKNTDYIIVGCSGGPDSMCLLQILHKNNYKIVCAHVNHNIREESKEEYEFMKQYCETSNIQFEGLELKKETNNEYYYRKKRYDFYKKLADKYNTKFIATAHHGDDLIETILMRINRGSNLKGYIGFNAYFQEKNYIFLKPLIYYTKDEIIEYNLENQIPFFYDKTNDDDTYTRNRYRHHVIPFLKEENKNVHKKYLQFSEELLNAHYYIKNAVQKEIKTNFKDNYIDLTQFIPLDRLIQKKEIEEILSTIYSDNIDSVNNKHIESIINSLDSNHNFSIDLPYGLVVRREYEKLIFGKNERLTHYKLELSDYNDLENGYIIERVKNTIDSSNNTIRLNNKDITYPLYIRTRCEGDQIEVKNLNGRKKVGDIFIENKIPRTLRDIYPILVDANDYILWIPGLKKSKFDSDINEKCDIILRYKRKGEIDEEKTE